MSETILVINAGSSSIKFSLFTYHELTLIYYGEIDGISSNPQFTVFDEHHHLLSKRTLPSRDYKSALDELFSWLTQLPEGLTLKAAGHRIVHGGMAFTQPTLITHKSFSEIDSFSTLAPLHQPYNLEAILNINKLHPTLPQVACFDTAFHHTQDRLATLFAIPRTLSEEGVIRYGFHGLSYEYIASVLPEHIGEKANEKVIVAHLGNGASLCAMKNRKSVATSMGLTALDGLMMGSRCGSLDPGVVLYLLEEKKYSSEQISDLLYHESGLLGVSGISSDMRELQVNSDPRAIEAIDLFCYRAARELSALCAALQGCDAIVFTAGIGEHSALVRKKICEHLTWLGVALDTDANTNHASIISQDISKVLVSIIPTNEEYMIAKHTLTVLSKLPPEDLS